MIFIILALTQTTCAFGNNTTVAQMVKSYAPDDNTTIDTDTLVELFTFLAEGVDSTQEALLEVAKTVDNNFDIVNARIILVIIVVAALFLITWISVCCCFIHYNTLFKTLRNPSEAIPLRSFSQ